MNMVYGLFGGGDDTPYPRTSELRLDYPRFRLSDLPESAPEVPCIDERRVLVVSNIGQARRISAELSRYLGPGIDETTTVDYCQNEHTLMANVLGAEPGEKVQELARHPERWRLPKLIFYTGLIKYTTGDGIGNSGFPIGTTVESLAEGLGIADRLRKIEVDYP